MTAELGRQNYAAAPFAGNVPEWDPVAADQQGYTVPVQVKAINLANSSWQFDMARYADIVIEASGQILRGPVKLLNPEIVCILVLLGSKLGEENFHILSLQELQSVLLKQYVPRKPPAKVSSTHVALRPRDMTEYRDRWKVIERAFARARRAAPPEL